MTKIVAVSGGFDVIHVGHIRYFKAAKELGDHLMVILNSDEWLKRKRRGQVTVPYEERKEVLEAIRYVDEVVPQIGHDAHIAASLAYYLPKVFAKGGDRTLKNIPEEEKICCAVQGIEIVTGVGGDKVQSSSWILERGEE